MAREKVRAVTRDSGLCLVAREALQAAKLALLLGDLGGEHRLQLGELLLSCGHIRTAISDLRGEREETVSVTGEPQ